MNPRTYIKQHEGLRLKPYQCTAGKLTIGYGHNLDDRGIPLEVAELLLDLDILDAKMDARSILPIFDNLSANRQIAMIDLVFNLGKSGLRKFVKFLAAMEAGDWTRAASELKDSAYYRQVPNRAEDNIKLILEG